MSQITVADFQSITYRGFPEHAGSASKNLYDVVVLNLFNVLSASRIPHDPLRAYLKPDANPDTAHQYRAELSSLIKSGANTKEALGELFTGIKELLDRTAAGGIFYIRALDKAISEFKLPVPAREAEK